MFQQTQKTDQSQNEDSAPRPNKTGLTEAELMRGHQISCQVGAPAQMSANQEEKEVQAKVDSGKAIQQQEDEEIQMKAPPAQMKEEEELVQGKAIQKAPEEEEVQMKESSGDNTQGTTSASSTQSTLPRDVNARMEAAFNRKFLDVNIHTNDSKATQMKALAFTQGNNVHFAPGQYNPHTSKGQELIGHEFTHVVQQDSGQVAPTTQAKGMSINDNPALENEADVMGKRAAEGKSANVSGVSSGVQKKEGESKVKSGGGTAPVKSNEANWTFKPELVKRFYPNYKGKDIHMFTYTYQEDGQEYIILRQDWSKGDNIGDYRYWATTGGGSWVQFSPTSRLDGLQKDMTNFAVFMIGSAGLTVGSAILIESLGTQAINFITSKVGKKFLRDVFLDLFNQYLVNYCTNGYQSSTALSNVDIANALTKGAFGMLKVKDLNLKRITKVFEETIKTFVDITWKKGVEFKEVSDEKTWAEFAMRQFMGQFGMAFSSLKSDGYKALLDIFKKTWRKYSTPLTEQIIKGKETNSDNDKR